MGTRTSTGLHNFVEHLAQGNSQGLDITSFVLPVNAHTTNHCTELNGKVHSCTANCQTYGMRYLLIFLCFEQKQNSPKNINYNRKRRMTNYVRL